VVLFFFWVFFFVCVFWVFFFHPRLPQFFFFFVAFFFLALFSRLFCGCNGCRSLRCFPPLVFLSWTIGLFGWPRGRPTSFPTFLRRDFPSPLFLCSEYFAPPPPSILLRKYHSPPCFFPCVFPNFRRWSPPRCTSLPPVLAPLDSFFPPPPLFVR